MFECWSDATIVEVSKSLAFAVMAWSFFRYVFGTKR